MQNARITFYFGTKFWLECRKALVWQLAPFCLERWDISVEQSAFRDCLVVDLKKLSWLSEVSLFWLPSHAVDNLLRNYINHEEKKQHCRLINKFHVSTLLQFLYLKKMVFNNLYICTWSRASPWSWGVRFLIRISVGCCIWAIIINISAFVFCR